MEAKDTFKSISYKLCMSESYNFFIFADNKLFCVFSVKYNKAIYSSLNRYLLIEMFS